MKYIAFSDEYGRYEGDTKEAAIEAALSQIQRRIRLYAEISDGVCLPLDVASRVPRPPTGFRLLVLEIGSHNDGEPYGWRFFAVTCAPFVLSRGYGEESDPEVKAAEKGKACDDGEAPIMHSFLDCNAGYYFRLPLGSMEYAEGSWVPRLIAQYHY